LTQPLDQWITDHEGVKLHPYTDTHGNLTIGIGHNLANGIPLSVAYSLRDLDIIAAQKAVITNFPWIKNIDMPRVDALVHLCFWIGIGSLMGFTKMMNAVRAEDWKTAHDELLNSKLFSDIPERTTEIANRLLTGVSP
jgi:lysozyme